MSLQVDQFFSEKCDNIFRDQLFMYKLAINVNILFLSHERLDQMYGYHMLYYTGDGLQDLKLSNSFQLNKLFSQVQEPYTYIPFHSRTLFLTFLGNKITVKSKHHV